MTKDEILDKVISHCSIMELEKSNLEYYMTPDSDELKLLRELVNDGLLLCLGDFAPNCFGGFNETYSFIPNDEKHKKMFNHN